jgi:hypothetical protein
LEGNLLVRLQAELVRATVRLTKYIGMHLAVETPAVHVLESCCTPFVASKLEGEDAVRALVRAADIALDARDGRAGDCESPFRLDKRRELGIDRIYEKLLKVIKMLSANEREMFAEVLERHRDGLEDAGTEESGQLRLDVVQWMSDLLWYTLRYWLPCYPTTTELAFELSLHVMDAPVRRAELAQAAQALETENLADLSIRIKKLMDYCEECQDQHEETSKSSGLFYDAIAVALQHEFERYSAPLPDGAAKWGRGQAQLDPPPLPMLFTTNFDRAMERAFEKSGTAFHVLFPVIRAGTVRGEGGRLPVTWKLRNWFSSERAKKTGKRFDDVYWESVCPADSSPSIDWEGPLIVKLHGSPSEQPGMSEDHHWMVLSEVGYLQALGGSAMPDWVRAQLHDSVEPGAEGRRSLWFLGYSIADWNVRLRLYQDSQVGGARRTFNRDADPYRMALLKVLGIDTFLGDLNEFPRFIAKALKDNEIETSPLVDDLVLKLASKRL